MKHLLFAGSFDPPTLGHLNIIQRGAKLCEKLTVGLALNTTKTGELLSHSDRMALLQELCRELPNVSIAPLKGLVADFVKKSSVDGLLRALRTVSDFEREAAMALANRKLCGIETLFLLSDPDYSHISSTLVREIAHFGGPLDSFVPAIVSNKLSTIAASKPCR